MAIKLEDISIRNTLIPGDLGYVIHLHGLLYRTEYGYGIEFETYVALGAYEFYKNYDPMKDRVWICEHNKKMLTISFYEKPNSNSLKQKYWFMHSVKIRL